MKDSKVTVVTAGRFHSFDLAEQLQAAGRLAAIYTGYPRFKLSNTRVDPALIRSFPWLLTPYMALGRFQSFPKSILSELSWRAHEFLDSYAAHTLPDCGVLSALSSSGLRVGTEMKRRGGVYVCDRGSTHILWQQEILATEYASLGLSWQGIDPRFLEKEQAEYALADAVTLPSSITIRSFVAMGVPAGKLRLMPYGVNLSAFRRSAERAKNFRVLFVGQLSVRKGLHYLLDAFRRAKLPDAELVLVGAAHAETQTLIGRYPLDGRLTLTGILPREGVVSEMSKASVLVLPSIEEGLALVMAQALACGTPVIATTHTGAEDLFESGREGFIINSRDVEALTERLTRLYRDKDMVEAMGAAGIERVKSLGGWDRYGATMMKVFDGLLEEKSSRPSNGGNTAQSHRGPQEN